MNEYRHGSHSVFEIHPHLVRVTKYRTPVLVGPIGKRARELIREIRGSHDVHTVKGHISEDPVHLLLSIPPEVTISRLVQRPRGKTACMMLQEFSALKREFWGRPVWARGYFCCGTGNVTDEAVAAYIANQGESGPGIFAWSMGTFSPSAMGSLEPASGGGASKPTRGGRT